MRTRVKICGITRTEDALAAVQSGADAIGLVFYPPSPRAVALDQASQIVAQLPPFVSVVGLFVDESAERIAEILARVPLGLLQFHGNETPAQCAGHGRPWIKAIRMRDGVDLLAEAERFADAAGLLLDSYQPGKPGGTGSTFSWDRIPTELAPNIILAGGLDPFNVESAVRQVRPYAVDVSGGVEQTKGIKDADKIAAFIEGVKRGDDC
ncbi:phosphoribosylanthranilate isomerase [Candidatus Endoriftia persephone]|jgi:phosphoribosylanthranilate isomerase|uniref:N-(5'-phosphoribosyl)anthranilate isomerase n=3 Tax=Gammaproteobacteria TaxID=1236 RepID=G2FGN2_9GAMM|nr:phosphoribosylanthranilate isomerase [Candidatus Endoriftia persephone]EGV50146.1 N-(5'-phosphoribosyl)anthranilate isomerase [endosymbiont of Riftia pachyptila (vent Ph05)]EGW53996.1 N-(5'-phosphoribosyl)anthranilate isomerase [endosymbiont of Tevnia jerichonana (vent Tica)]USF86543.1 phosphoribosylanthranilate isomerase [Candidatus Endoriftia persephone]